MSCNMRCCRSLRLIGLSVSETPGKVFMALEELNKTGWLQPPSGGPCENSPSPLRLGSLVKGSNVRGFEFRILSGQKTLLTGVSKPSSNGVLLTFQTDQLSSAAIMRLSSALLS